MRTVSNPANNLTIINLGKRGGLGHKFSSMLLSLTYAIMLKRNYKSEGYVGCFTHS